MDSILESVKKTLGIEPDDTAFNDELIIHINSVFMILQQLGIGPAVGFSISGSAETWSQFVPDASHTELVRSYMYSKVRLLFDPPQNSALLEAMKEQISEFEWRLAVKGETV